MFNSLTNNQVPAIWVKVAYPSLKPLASWVTDAIDRLAFMASWISEGEPASFWLPGLFLPQGFMTAALQNHARKTQIAIDRLNFGFEVLTEYDGAMMKEQPEDGVYCHGMFLDSARWNDELGCLEEAAPRQIEARLPVIHFKPAEDYRAPGDQYQCPLYKTSVRAGTLNTTGQSTNFVLHVSLPVSESHADPTFWTVQGVAAPCAMD